MPILDAHTAAEAAHAPFPSAEESSAPREGDPAAPPVMGAETPVDRRRFRPDAGFTLIELVIVMAIIALLASMVAPQVIGELGKAQTKSTSAQIELLGTALDSYRLDNGRYPSTQDGLEVLIKRPENLPTWGGPYLRKRSLPKDAWGKPFQYNRPATRGGIEYDLFSLGADGEPGGEGDDADIGNW